TRWGTRAIRMCAAPSGAVALSCGRAGSSGSPGYHLHPDREGGSISTVKFSGQELSALQPRSAGGASPDTYRFIAQRRFAAFTLASYGPRLHLADRNRDWFGHVDHLAIDFAHRLQRLIGIEEGDREVPTI